MKTVLLHVYGDEGQKARLDAAVALVRAFDGRLQCIQVKAMSSYVVAEPFGGAYMVGELYKTLERQAREEKAKIEQFRKSLTTEQVGVRSSRQDYSVSGLA